MIGNGLMIFQGGKNPLKAGPGAVLTDLIDAFTHSDDSHSAIAFGGQLYESTIEKGVRGPQVNDADERIAEYRHDGGHALLFPFLPQFRPDWEALLAGAEKMIALRKAGKMPYSVKRLFGDAVSRSILFDMVALPADGIISYLSDHDLGVVCSEMAAFLMQYGGVDSKAYLGGVQWLPAQHGQPIGCAPADLVAMHIWDTPQKLL